VKENKIYYGDCMNLMELLEDSSIDMILCDLPYGTTKCGWDQCLPLPELWDHYTRIISPNGAIVLTASQPFTSELVMSNRRLFRYEWIWEKTLFTNFAMVKKQPAKKHENVLVFYKKQPVYNPQMEEGTPYKDKPRRRSMGVTGNAVPMKKAIDNKGERYPGSVQLFSNGNNKNVHPTQKPLELFRYLVRTYTNPGDLVLDNCAGSGTTGVACLREGRRYILMEKDPEYFEICKKRIIGEVASGHSSQEVP
jgi:site-specific DNA-methyltransferase (adenine-specific)